MSYYRFSADEEVAKMPLPPDAATMLPILATVADEIGYTIAAS